MSGAGPLWSARQAGGQRSAPLTTSQAARHFSLLIEELTDAGDFQEWFGHECVDSGLDPGKFGPHPVDRIELEHSRNDLWPVADHWQGWDQEALLDAIELLGRLVSAGDDETGYFHSWGECGWHYSQFDRIAGFERYRDRVNVILSRYGDGFTLTGDGRIERSLTPGDEDLLRVDESAPPLSEEGQIALAVRKFRQASLTSRREAVQILIDVLEPHRDAVREMIGRPDEAGLFETANKFWLRHNNADQAKDYDHEIWWDWLFNLYLSSIRLIQALEARAAGTAGPVAELIKDLDGDPPSVFYKGTLAQRLAGLRLAELPPEALRRLGIAVGHRARGGTIVVFIDGFEACARTADTESWPSAYRLAIVEGAFLTGDGQLHTIAATVDVSVHALNADGVDHRERIRLLTRIAEAPLAYDLSRSPVLIADVAKRLRAAATSCNNPDVKAAWGRIADRFASS